MVWCLVLVCGWTCRGSAWGFLWLWLSLGRGPFSLFRRGVLIWLECFSVKVRCISKGASVSAGGFLCFGGAGVWGGGLVPVGCIWAPRWLGLLSVLGRWYCCCWLYVYCNFHCGSLWLFYVLLCVTLCRFRCCGRLGGGGGGGGWLLCLVCLPGVLWWLGGSSSRCHGVVCGLWLWYFLIILTIFEIPEYSRISTAQTLMALLLWLA